MRTSAIRHPKHEHAITVHSWMMKVTSNNLYAANLIAYLEAKFNIMLDCKEKHGGWIKLHKIQVKNGIFSADFYEVDQAIELLGTLGFLEVDVTGSINMPLNEGEAWYKFNVLRVNEWLDIYSKNTPERMMLLNFMPFLGLLLFVTSEHGEIQQELQLTSNEKEVDTTYVEAARNLFQFWKYKTGHVRSNLQEKFANQIIARIKDKYTEPQIAWGIIGLTRSRHHIDNKYDHIKYVVRDTSQLDRMMDIAEKTGTTLEAASQEYIQFISKFKAGEHIEPEEKVFTNPSTGTTLK